MKQLQTVGIVLSRTDFGEADRIVTMLTPEHGKLRLMARGVRKQKSKLAGGIELFSTSDVTYIQGRGEIGTMISTRLRQHYGDIVKNIERVQLGYDLIKTLNKATEDEPEPEYFTLLEQSFAALNDSAVSSELILVWFQAQLLKIAGHAPNLKSDTNGQKLAVDQAYNFDFDAMCFAPHPQGNFKADQIKVMRLVFGSNPPVTLNNVQGLHAGIPTLAPLLRSMRQTHLNL